MYMYVCMYVCICYLKCRHTRYCNFHTSPFKLLVRLTVNEILYRKLLSVGCGRKLKVAKTTHRWMAVPSAPRILLLAFSISYFLLVSLPLRACYPRVLVMEKIKYFWSYREWNSDSLIIQLVAWSLYWLSYAGFWDFQKIIERQGLLMSLCCQTWLSLLGTKVARTWASSYACTNLSTTRGDVSAGSLFYLTNIVSDLPPLFQPACGRPLS